MDVVSDTVGRAKRQHKEGCWVCARKFRRGWWVHTQVVADEGRIWTAKACKRCDRWFMKLLAECINEEVQPDWVLGYRREVLTWKWRERKTN